MSDAVTEKLLVLDLSRLEPETGAPAAERVVAGNPAHRTWNFEDDGHGTYAGLWESTPGEWRVEYEEWEFCHVISGVMTLAEDGSEPKTFRAGDSFVVRPGFRGTWRVVETMRKHYVVRT